MIYLTPEQGLIGRRSLGQESDIKLPMMSESWVRPASPSGVLVSLFSPFEVGLTTI
jgi:hypothetical protein